MASKPAEGAWTAGLGLALVLLGAATLVWAQRPGLSPVLVSGAGGLLGAAVGGWGAMLILTYAPLPSRAPLLQVSGLAWAGALSSLALYALCLHAWNPLVMLGLVSAGIATAVNWVVWGSLDRHRQD